MSLLGIAIAKMAQLMAFMHNGILPSGVAYGSEFQVNTYTAGDQWYPAIAALADGGYVINLDELWSRWLSLWRLCTTVCFLVLPMDRSFG